MSELLLLSGGIDSAAVAAWRRPALCLTIDYGQKSARAESQASKQICADLNLQHKVGTWRISELGAGDMSSNETSLHSTHTEFWPFRNQYLITMAAMVAIKEGCRSLLIGTVLTDSRHRDGSLDFVSALDHVLSLQEGEIRLDAPAVSLTSTELIRLSGIQPSTLGWTHSCHVSDFACGKCRGCQKHSEVMSSLGLYR
ncbi:MAG: 7-cyano-7-deazaguanine synthase [Moraxellaceae bacterium]